MNLGSYKSILRWFSSFLLAVNLKLQLLMVDVGCQLDFELWMLDVNLKFQVFSGQEI